MSHHKLLGVSIKLSATLFTAGGRLEPFPGRSLASAPVSASSAAVLHRRHAGEIKEMPCSTVLPSHPAEQSIRAICHSPMVSVHIRLSEVLQNRMGTLESLPQAVNWPAQHRACLHLASAARLSYLALSHHRQLRASCGRKRVESLLFLAILRDLLSICQDYQFCSLVLDGLVGQTVAGQGALESCTGRP